MQAEINGKVTAPARRWTVQQVADFWQIHPGTVRKAIRAGNLPAVWAGNGYRMLAEDVEAWIMRTWGR